jgi:hypothetical protein
MKSVQLKGIMVAAAIALTSAANANVAYGEFNLTAYDNAIDLRWQSMTEDQNAYFRIERSFNGTDWFVIGTVPGSGTTFDPNAYLFTDAAPLPGKNYYRIMDVDSSGNEFVGPTMFHDYTTMTVCDFVVYPNPADNYLLMYWEDCPPAAEWTVRLVSQSGHSMMTQVTDGSQFLQLDVTSFPTGLYKVAVTQRGSRITLKKSVYIN